VDVESRKKLHQKDLGGMKLASRSTIVTYKSGGTYYFQDVLNVEKWILIHPSLLSFCIKKISKNRS
jgi:hypothetical protein